MSEQKKQVFSDNSGKRWRKFQKTTGFITLLTSIVGAIFCISLATLPQSPLGLRDSKHGKRLILPTLRKDKAVSKFLISSEHAKLDAAIRDEQQSIHRLHPESEKIANTITIGFYANWDPSGYDSFSAHADSLSYIMPQWLEMDASGSNFKSLYDKTSSDPAVVRLARTHNVKIIPMLGNTGKDGFEWAKLKNLLESPSKFPILAGRLHRYLQEKQYDGINIDLEPNYANLNPADTEQERQLIYYRLPDLVKTIKNEFQGTGLIVTQDVPATDRSFNYSALGEINDLLIVMFYDQHVASGQPGPLAGQEWLESVSDKLMKNLDPSKTILGLANFCADWPVKQDNNGDLISTGTGKNPTIGEALKLASDLGLDIQMDENDLNPFLTYADENGQDRYLVMLDAVTAYNEIKAMKGYNLRGAALWRLGAEDPAIWNFFDHRKLENQISDSSLQNVDFKFQVGNDPLGQGEIKEVTSLPHVGHRIFNKDKDGLIVSEKYDQYPSPYVVSLFGKADKKIALTFDDGPDTKFTPVILRILKKYKAPATFFVIGKEAEVNPEILTQEWDQGCDIGNHTFTHPHIATVSSLRCDMELNTTQRIIESAIGRSTRLFRPPYGEGADVDSSSPQDVLLMNRTQKLGYVSVGMNIDPKDYKEPAPEVIIKRILNSLPKPGQKLYESRNVVLLHDGGGDRTETVEALPGIIRELRKRGYQLVTVSELLGPDGRQKMYTPVSPYQATIAGFDRIAFEIQYALGNTLGIAFLLAIILGVLRIALIAPLALIHGIRKYRSDDSYTPSVTVLVPSFNEGKVICRTIDSIQKNDYTNLKIIIIDDGSTDDTEQIVQQNYASSPDVKYIRKENGGKASALNVGLEQADTEIVVCIDADTILAKDSIRKLIKPLADPKVGAVAGNVKVGNRATTLTMCQSLEYITSQNFDRLAYSALRTVPIIPGAIGAWRRDVILNVGGYDSDTLAEDCDLTLRLLVSGYHTVSANDALAFTEAPEDVKSLAKQRFRWSFGVLQVLWKHRKQLFRPRYGAIAMLVMPLMWIFNVILQILAPLVDLMVVYSLFTGQFWSVAAYAAALFVLDFIASLSAFLMDRENPTALSWLFFQRFFYRQFMYYVIIRSVIAAIHGGIVGWGKLERKGTVSQV